MTAKRIISTRPHVSIRLSPEQADRVDQIRGLVPRDPYTRMLIDDALDRLEAQAPARQGAPPSRRGRARV